MEWQKLSFNDNNASLQLCAMADTLEHKQIGLL